MLCLLALASKSNMAADAARTYLNALANLALNSSSNKHRLNRSLLESLFCCLKLLDDELNESSFLFLEDILNELKELQFASGVPRVFKLGYQVRLCNRAASVFT